MGYKLKNKLELAIQFEVGSKFVEFPLANESVLTELCITESTRIAVPTIYLKVNDGDGFFNLCPLLDGNRLTVSMIAEGKVLAKSVFRIFSFTSTFVGTSNSYTIEGYLDCPKYWLSSNCSVYDGNSSFVVSEIARICGLTAETDQTHDSQLWCQGNLTNSQFISYMTKHGFKNNTSYLVSALRTDGTLVYKDVNAIKDADVNVVAYSRRQGYVTATDINIRSNSGLNNATGGYASLMVDSSLVREDQVYKNLTVTNLENILNLNAQVASGIKRDMVYHSLIGADQNSNYWLGTYQNTRYAKLYNVDCAMITDMPTPLSPLRSFKLAVSESGNLNTSNSGLYIVDTKTIIIRGVVYAERINATRKGVNK